MGLFTWKSDEKRKSYIDDEGYNRCSKCRQIADNGICEQCEKRERLLRGEEKMTRRHSIGGRAVAFTVTAVKGFEKMMTARDIAEIIGKPVRFVIREYLNTGIIKGRKFGGNSWRILPRDFKAFYDSYATGFNHARPSGGKRSRGDEQ